MKYYLIDNGTPAGPFDREELAAHDITPDTQVWHEDLETWTAARDISSLADLFTGNTPQATTQPSAAYGQGSCPPPYAYGYPRYAPAESAAPANFRSGKGLAVTSIVIASMAMVFGIFCLFIPWIFAIPSLILAILSMSKAGDAVRVAATGNIGAADRMAHFARTMGIISIILGILALAPIPLGFFVLFSAVS